MHTSDKVLLIIGVMAVCCFVVPFIPGGREWFFTGSGSWMLPSFLITVIAWTAWGHN